MTPPFDVAVLVGSLRDESFTRKTARALISLAPPTLRLEVVEIGHLPHYNADLETSLPPEWVAFRRRLTAADAMLFATPEYNRSVPGVLKNAIDIGSRPKAENSIGNKPGAVISVSTGALGAFGANHHLRQSLVFLDIPAMPQPEVYIGSAATLFDAQGNLINDSTREFLRKFLVAFTEWIERFVTRPS